MNDRRIPIEYPSQKGFANVIGLLATDPLESYSLRLPEVEEEPVQAPQDL